MMRHAGTRLHGCGWSLLGKGAGGTLLGVLATAQQHLLQPAGSRCASGKPADSGQGQFETRAAWVPAGHSQSEPAVANSPEDSVAASVASLHPTLQEMHAMLCSMGLQPGVACVVGDGLAIVDLGLFVQGQKIAIELKPANQPPPAARAYALERVRERAIQAHGWKLLEIPEQEWSAVGSSAQADTQAGSSHAIQHQRLHYLLDKLREVVQPHSSHNHDHQHKPGGGCCGGH